MTPSPDMPASGMMTEGRATWKCDQAEGYGPLYYIALTERAQPPYRHQKHVEAILDIADDGTLAGIELIDDMPPPPDEAPASGMSAEPPTGGKSLRRWTIGVGHSDGKPVLIMERTDDGEWSRYDNALEELAAKDKEIEGLIAAVGVHVTVRSEYLAQLTALKSLVTDARFERWQTVGMEGDEYVWKARVAGGWVTYEDVAAFLTRLNEAVKP